MINPSHFRELIVRPALEETKLWTQSAENLIVGTALAESSLTHLTQVPSGPGLGIFQFEEATYFDVVKYLHRKNELAVSILDACHYQDFPRNADVLISNLKYATLMARVFYWRFPEPLPYSENIKALGQYWKDKYNTKLGAGTVEKFVNSYIGE